MAIRCALALVLAAMPVSGRTQDAPGVAHPASWPAGAGAGAFPIDSMREAIVEKLLAAMTLEEKVGQLVQADIDSVRPEDLLDYPLGSILAGGNAAPQGDVRVGPAAWRSLADRFHQPVTWRGIGAHAPIPVLLGIDAVHGHAHVVGATVFPHNVALGATRDADLIERIGRATAEEVAATGMDWTFAPTVAVVRDVRWGRSYESFSEDPYVVAELGRAMIEGLQGRIGSPDFLARGHTLVSVKHFLGDGGTLDGRDQFDNRADEAVLREVHAAPYRAAIAAGASTVMASYNGWQGTKMHANASLLTGVLKDRWSFPGFVVGDWNAQEEVPGCTKYSCPALLAAGVDMYMAPDSWKQVYANLLAQARDGTLARTRIDDAARRILRVKALTGAFDATGASGAGTRPGLEVLGSAAHRRIAREAVQKSLVLLKNDGHLLPLEPHAHVLVTGPGADDIGMQCGGWTIDWQGDHNRNADFPGGTSIYAGIKAAVERAGGSAELSGDGSYHRRPSVAIAIYGEQPYAEFEGDRETLEFSGADAPHLAILRRLRAAGIPVVSVFLSGRPLWVNRELNLSRAFIAAWLPGTEGEGVADLLFKAPRGEQPHDFTGRLGFSWPATAMPVHFDASGTARDALFARGYGLSAAANGTLPPLAEDPGRAPDRGSPDSLFSHAHVTAPWSVFVADAIAQVRLTMASQASPGGVATAALDGAALRATWSGSGDGDVWIGGRAADYTAAARDGLELVARYRVDVRPTQPVGLGIKCDPPYGPRPPPADPAGVEWSRCARAAGAFLDVSQEFTSKPLGSWQEVHLPLACLARYGVRLSTVSAPFVARTAGRLDVTIAEVRFVRASVPRECPPALQ